MTEQFRHQSAKGTHKLIFLLRVVSFMAIIAGSTEAQSSLGTFRIGGDSFLLQNQISGVTHPLPVTFASTLNYTKATEPENRISRTRLIVNLSLGTLTAVGLAGWWICDIRSERLRKEIDRPASAVEITPGLVKWDRLIATRNFFGVLALGSGTALAVTLIIPIGKDECKGSNEKRANKIAPKNRDKEITP